MTAYTVQKGDDGGDDSDSDGGSAVRLVRLALVIRPLSEQLDDKSDFLDRASTVTLISRWLLDKAAF